MKLRFQLSEEQRVAACVMHLFAVLHFEETRPDVWWFRWCVEHSGRATGFEASVWWALRYRDDEVGETAEEWLGYVAYVHAARRA